MTMAGMVSGKPKTTNAQTRRVWSTPARTHFLFSSLLPFFPPKNLTKQKFYSKIKQKRKEVKFLYNKKIKPQPRIYFPGKIKKVTL
jgi:hypothetical protein